MLDNSLVILAQAEPSPLPRAVASANYNQTWRASFISLRLAPQSGIKYRSHVPAGSGIVCRVPHLPLPRRRSGQWS